MAGKNIPTRARDTNKLIRQLSLVAYLMANQRRRVDADTIRWNVEGYGNDMNWEAFTRAFHRDREELASLGIVIEHQHDEFDNCEIYRLPPDNYFLPAVEFSREELAALNTCLCLLDGQFAYSRLLRLALQGLALGSGNPLDDPVTGCFAVNLISSGEDEEAAARQREIDNFISQRKTVVFDYEALSTGATETRTVDPYAPIFTRGEWYLVGYSHERQAIRIYKLKRIQGRIRALSPKKDHNFDIPEDFRAHDYLNLEPWQLGPAVGEAEIYFSPRMGWWAANNLAGSGSLETKADESAILRTPFSDDQALCSLVLGMHSDATILGPPGLRAAMASALDKIRSVHEEEAPAIAAEAVAGKTRRDQSEAGSEAKSGAGGEPERHSGARGARQQAFQPSHDMPQVPPERFPQLAKTISYLIGQLGKEETVRLPVAEVCRDLGFDTRQMLEQNLELLFMVNTGPGEYLVEACVKGDYVVATGGMEKDLLRRPARLSPREARALLLAIDLVGSQILAGEFESLQTARGKILEAAGGIGESQAIAVGETEREDPEICRIINHGLKEHQLVEIEYLSHNATEPETRSIEPYLFNRVKGQWYLHAWSRERDAMRTFRLEMIKSARLPGEAFEPRPDETLDLNRYVRDPRFPSGEKAPHVAEVRFSPEVAPWVRENQSNITELEDGSVIGRIPYFDGGDGWVVSEVLKYAGEAMLISPARLRGQIAFMAEDMAREYRQA